MLTLVLLINVKKVIDIFLKILNVNTVYLLDVNNVMKIKINVKNVSLDSDYGNLLFPIPKLLPMKTLVKDVKLTVINVMLMPKFVKNVRKDITYSMEYVNPDLKTVPVTTMTVLVNTVNLDTD